ncbi:MAG TPA: hypothetical protein VKV39_19690 [Candidatus Sulfotelmatobacter sp.]|nr:hypothetical protein [Candidatus Sulfotelmatobacter sp.]
MPPKPWPHCRLVVCLFPVILIGAAVAYLPPAVLASKTFVKPVAQPAKTYPAHDDHSDEKVAIAADPYDTPEKARIFSINFEEHGFLPVFFVVSNDGDQPVSIVKMEITLVTRNRSKLTPISTEDLYRRLSNPQAQTRPSPIPIPRKGVKGTISDKQRDEIETSQFAARAVEPHSTQSGFLFFDVRGISEPLAAASMEITGVEDAKGNELIFFEIPMNKYLNAPAKP